MMYKISESGPVPLTYTDLEIHQLVDNFIKESKGEFSYKRICDYIVSMAKQDGKVEGAPYAEYRSFEISISDGYTISRVLWEKIWNKEIIIAFGENSYRCYSNGDKRFIKV